MSNTSHAAEPAASAVASKFGYAGSGATIVGGLLSNEMAVAVGMLVGVLGFAIGWFYKHKENKRRQEFHDLQMEKLRAQSRV